MADTLVKKPKLIVGTQSQVEAEMGANDIGFATDVEFYTSKQIDELLSKAGGASLPILMPTWSDHVINDMSWLRADTFSWQSGDVYKVAYEHLANDIATMYAWSTSSYVFYTLTDTPAVGDDVYFVSENYGTSKVLSVSNDTITFEHHRTGETTTATRNPSSDTNALAYGLNKSTDTIGDITITYYLAQDGHKICLPDQESNLIALYEATGAADYYILDTTNNQFKLPRENKDGKYLYFYVGNFTQEAIEQTAGLNTELFNGKADVDLNNINPSNSAKATIVGWGMPDYSAGVVVADGYQTTFPCFVTLIHPAVATANSAVVINIDGVRVAMNVAGGAVSKRLGAWCYVDAGHTITIDGSDGSPVLTVYPLKGVN